MGINDKDLQPMEVPQPSEDHDVDEKLDYDFTVWLRQSCKGRLEGFNRTGGEQRAKKLHIDAGILCSIALGKNVGPMRRESYPPALPYTDKNAARDENGPLLEPMFIFRALQTAVDDTEDDNPELEYRQFTRDAALEYLTRVADPRVLEALRLLSLGENSTELPGALQALFDADIPFDHMNVLLCTDLDDPDKKKLRHRQYQLGDACLSHYKQTSKPASLKNAKRFLEAAAGESEISASDWFDLEKCQQSLEEAQALDKILNPEVDNSISASEQAQRGVESHRLFIATKDEDALRAAVSDLDSACRKLGKTAPSEMRYSLAEASLDLYKVTLSPSGLNDAIVAFQLALEGTPTGTAEYAVRQQGLQDSYLLAFSVPPPDVTGDVLKTGDFPLASGGFGDVWQGQLVKDFTTRRVAIKVVRKAWDDEEVFTKRFHRELGIWHHLSRSHANILPLLGVCSNFGPTLSMVSPWFEKGNLYNLIQEEHETMTLDARLELLWGVACGLQHLHMYNLLHGDLSSSNVLIQYDGVPCLADFGLSRVLFDPSEASSREITVDDINDRLGAVNIIENSPESTIGGSLRYSAPEMWDFDGDHPLDPIKRVSTRTDVYSFGSLMLEVLTGQVPYHDLKSEGQILLKVYSGIPPTAPDGTTVTTEQWDVINRCWARDPAKRPTAHQVSLSVAQLPRGPDFEEDEIMSYIKSIGFKMTKNGGMALDFSLMDDDDNAPWKNADGLSEVGEVADSFNSDGPSDSNNLEE